MPKRDHREISLLLKQAQQRKQIAVDTALSKLQSSMAQWVVLRRIRSAPGASAHDLAQAAFQTDQSFGSVTRRLIARGLVIREQGKGRSTAHHLSDAGRKLLEKCDPIVVATLRLEFAVLSEDELQNFGAFLAKIVGENQGVRTSHAAPAADRERC